MLYLVKGGQMKKILPPFHLLMNSLTSINYFPVLS